jgi:hypothetical protein
MVFGAPFPGGKKVKGLLVNPWVQGGEDQQAFSASFGTEEQDRILVACVYGALNISQVNAVSIGGVGASLVARAFVGNANGGGEMSDLWVAAVAAGTSGAVDFAFTVHGSVAFDLYALYGAKSITPVATNQATSNPASLPINVPDGAFVIGNASAFGAVGSYAWTGLAEDAHSSLSTITRSSASAQILGARLPLLVGVTMPSSTDACGVCAAWGP